MAEGYAKLLSSIVRSSIWSENDAVVRVWVTMLAIADRNGLVFASVDGLAHEARKTVEETEGALAKFLAPDPRSRSKNDDGRRIREVDGGWQLINYAKIRDMHQTETSRARKRKWWNDNRGKSSVSSTTSSKPSASNETSSHGSVAVVGSDSHSGRFSDLEEFDCPATKEFTEKNLARATRCGHPVDELWEIFRNSRRKDGIKFCSIEALDDDFNSYMLHIIQNNRSKNSNNPAGGNSSSIELPASEPRF